MELYHATSSNNIGNIKRYGICPYTGWQSNNWDVRIIKKDGIYGFTTIKDAIGFGRDQCFNGGIAIFSFYADEDEIVLDPEYDDPLYGIAYFVPTESGIDAKLVYNSQDLEEII